MFARDIISLHIWSFSLIRFIYSHFCVIFYLSFALFRSACVCVWFWFFSHSLALFVGFLFVVFASIRLLLPLLWPIFYVLSFAFVIFTERRFYAKISLWNVYSDDSIVENVCCCCCYYCCCSSCCYCCYCCYCGCCSCCCCYCKIALVFVDSHSAMCLVGRREKKNR